MKVVIPAGGLGTRAKPFTDILTKTMMPVDGKPIIDYIIRYLSKFSEIDEIIIICDLVSKQQIKSYFEGKENILNKKITYVEDKFDGTGGSILRAEELLKKSISIENRLFGRHPTHARHLVNYGILLDNKNRWISARRYYKKAYAIILESLGKSHPQAREIEKIMHESEAKRWLCVRGILEIVLLAALTAAIMVFVSQL